METVISLKNLTKVFQDPHKKKVLAIKNINLDIYRGEFFVFIGSSGSGKSTLLRIMSGLEKSYNGEINLGEGINRNDIGFVFQQFALLPWLTVLENVELGLMNRPISDEERRVKAIKELEKLGLGNFASSYPKELSGGMKQRVGIARALAIDPKIIFLDEPFSELDSFTANELRREFLGIWKETKSTIVMVTHLIDDAIELADRVAVLTSRPGKIEKIVENNIPRPRQKRTPEFFHMEDELLKLIKP